MRKEELRRLALRKRNALTRTEVKEKSARIVKRLRPYLQGKVALYESYSKEVCLEQLKLTSYALPCVLNDKEIEFRMCHADSELETGAFGILEPTKGEIVAPSTLDVIVVPLVAFDDALHRMGHGKGYYDRYLKQCKAFKIGVAFECQHFEAVPCEAHDVALGMIISEVKIYE